MSTSHADIMMRLMSIHIGCCCYSAGHANMPMYSNRQAGQAFVSQQGCFGPMARPMYPQPTGSFGGFSMSNMMTTIPAYAGGFYQDASGNLQPLTPQTAPAVTAMEGMDPKSQQMVQVHACLCMQAALLYVENCVLTPGGYC